MVVGFELLKNVIESTLDLTFPADARMTENGFHYELLDNLSIGIWVMPNNNDNGYLEHFIGNLIGEESELWKFAIAKVEELMEKDFNELSLVKKQKGLIHSYLAWKSTPGLPMGTAVKSNYINALSPNANPFISWFEKVFELDN